jgi:hypothetical protein
MKTEKEEVLTTSYYIYAEDLLKKLGLKGHIQELSFEDEDYSHKKYVRIILLK